MKRQGGGFGFVMMLVVLAVIFYVAMNNFKHIAPAAIAVDKHNKTRKAGQDVAPEDFEPKNDSKSSSADAWTETPPARPNLDTMDKRTDDHSAQVKDALSHTD
jgi:hypothetical protein